MYVDAPFNICCSYDKSQCYYLTNWKHASFYKTISPVLIKFINSSHKGRPVLQKTYRNSKNKQTKNSSYDWLNTQTCHLPMYVFCFLEIPTEVGIVPQWGPCAEATDSCNSSSFLSWSFLIPSKILAVKKRIHQCTSHLFSFNLLL